MLNEPPPPRRIVGNIAFCLFGAATPPWPRRGITPFFANADRPVRSADSGFEQVLQLRSYRTGASFRDIGIRRVAVRSQSAAVLLEYQRVLRFDAMRTAGAYSNS